jgi:hypothetical protein
MIIGNVGAYEADDICKIVDRMLRDLGNPEPPLDLVQVRSLLDLNLRYYSTADPSFLQEVTHHLSMAGRQLIREPMRLFDAVRKSGLTALWLPKSKSILIDQAVPKPKHRWIEGHEIGHSMIPWHREFLFGDNEITLDPTCHATIEAEANYASARMLFLQDRFGAEARDSALNFKTVQAMAKRYGNTLTTTFWRIIEDRTPDLPVFGMMTAHPHHPHIGRGDQGEEIRYFIRSQAFRQKFGAMTAEQGYALITKHATRRSRGPVFTATDVLIDDRGEVHEFVFESFCNTYALLTIGSAVQLKPTMVATHFA